jgi:hypothetical protein
VATAAHGEVCSSLFVVTGKSNETTVRGFWQGYRTLMGDALDD